MTSKVHDLCNNKQDTCLRQGNFSPRHNATGESRLRHKGRQALCHDTVNGTVRIERIRWWSKQGGCDETIDRVLGIVADHVSVGVRQGRVISLTELPYLEYNHS